jgi:hypothetical protein
MKKHRKHTSSSADEFYQNELLVTDSHQITNVFKNIYGFKCSKILGRNLEFKKLDKVNKKH